MSSNIHTMFWKLSVYVNVIAIFQHTPASIQLILLLSCNFFLSYIVSVISDNKWLLVFTSCNEGAEKDFFSGNTSKILFYGLLYLK